MIGGIFVGGRGRRMGGVAKGLLVAPEGGTIVARTQILLEGAGATCVLVGDHPAYASLDLRVIADDPGAEGPLGGLLALLAWAEARGSNVAIALACDMPFVDAALVRRLVDAPAAPVVAPRHDGIWEPLFARWSVDVLPRVRTFAASGDRKLQRLLDAVGARPLALSDDELLRLRDWDRPEEANQNEREPR